MSTETSVDQLAIELENLSHSKTAFKKLLQKLQTTQVFQKSRVRHKLAHNIAKHGIVMSNKESTLILCFPTSPIHTQAIPKRPKMFQEKHIFEDQFQFSIVMRCSSNIQNKSFQK